MKKNKIDYGKIMALHNASWGPGEIAGEMGMSEEEYYRILAGLLEKLDKKIKRLECAYRAVSGLLKGWPGRR